mmetsp:Transcript_6186/g.24087  ORF Transcript_6186/g.24087 Transcript_6186/m.24087 type:complete len:334 (-) Transcript_6186:90-1091(-)
MERSPRLSISVPRVDGHLVVQHVLDAVHERVPRDLRIRKEALRQVWLLLLLQQQLWRTSVHATVRDVGEADDAVLRKGPLGHLERKVLVVESVAEERQRSTEDESRVVVALQTACKQRVRPDALRLLSGRLARLRREARGVALEDLHRQVVRGVYRVPDPLEAHGGFRPRRRVQDMKQRRGPVAHHRAKLGVIRHIVQHLRALLVDVYADLRRQMPNHVARLCGAGHQHVPSALHEVQDVIHRIVSEARGRRREDAQVVKVADAVGAEAESALAAGQREGQLMTSVPESAEEVAVCGLHAGLLQEHEGTLPAGNAAQLQRRRRRSLGTATERH